MDQYVPAHEDDGRAVPHGEGSHGSASHKALTHSTFEALMSPM